MTIAREWLSVGLMLVGAALMLVAAVGVVRMPDLFSRMQAATKATALGAGCTMLAMAVHFGDLAITTRVVLIILFLLLTAPISAHMLGRAAYFVALPLWEGTTRDELRDHYNRQTHALESGPERPPPARQSSEIKPS
jgi:multicomponent Na+:H+ antiporter subunit G